MPGKVVRFPDPEKRSRNADAVHRDPDDSAIIIVLPIIRVERYAPVTPDPMLLLKRFAGFDE